MSIDTPAKIAILGAGPVGLEAALYARFLGYDVAVFEGGDIANNVAEWGHVKMFSPFSMNASPLGLAAIAAQDETYQSPGEDELLTGQQFRDRYLIPLSQTDLLSDFIFRHTTVIALGRDGFLKNESVGQTTRAASKFRILTEGADGQERYHDADVVIDSSGTWNQPRWLGRSGIPAIGERELAKSIEYHLPDMDTMSDRYGNQHTLVIGSGYSAATTIVALASLVKTHPRTRVTWLTRRDSDRPIAVIPDDPLEERQALSDAANRIAGQDPVRHLGGCSVSAIQRTDEGQFDVRITGACEQTVSVDHVIANVGFKPDMSILSELQLHKCYATDGPMKLAALLLSSSATDCLRQPKTQSESLMTTEANFYILGSKSYGRNAQFLLSSGLMQVRQLFGVIAGRQDLNLYSNIEQSR